MLPRLIDFALVASVRRAHQGQRRPILRNRAAPPQMSISTRVLCVSRRMGLLNGHDEEQCWTPRLRASSGREREGRTSGVEVNASAVFTNRSKFGEPANHSPDLMGPRYTGHYT